MDAKKSAVRRSFLYVFLTLIKRLYRWRGAHGNGGKIQICSGKIAGVAIGKMPPLGANGRKSTLLHDARQIVHVIACGL